MANESANIGLTVGANIDPLRGDLNRAAGYVSQFGSDATTSIGRFSYDAGVMLGNVAKAFAATGAAAVAGLTAITIAGANFIDNQSKLARQLVGTVDGINALQYAADLSGVAIEPLSENIRKLNAMLANPSDASKKALDALGLSARELLKMDVDERVAALSDRFAELGYTLPQIDAALKQIGVEGKDVGKLFLEGGEGIRAAREELLAWGFAVSDIEASKIEAVNDSFSKATRILDGIGQVIAAKVAPYIEDLINRFTELAKTGGGAGGLIASAFDPVFKVMTFTIDAVAGIGRAFEVAGKTAALAFLSVEATLWATAGAILNGPAKAVNYFIDTLDKIPGIDIDFRVPTTIGDAFTANAKTALDAVTVGMADIQATLLKPLPGTAIENWAAGVKTSIDSVKSAADFSGSETGALKLPVDFTEANDALDMFAEKLDQETRAKLDAFGESLTMPSSEEIFDKFASDADKYRAHWDEMNAVAVAGAGAVAQTVADKFGNAAGSTAAAGKSMLESFSQSSRKMFEINKAWGYADAVISTAQGIAKGVSLGFPAGIPAVAWAVANGAAQISKIRAQTFGGGGSAPAGVQTGGGGQAPQGQPSPETQQQRGGSLRIEGFDPSHLYRGDQLQNMAGALEEFWNDGGGKGRVIFAGKK
jgi:hypothetical protein